MGFFRSLAPCRHKESIIERRELPGSATHVRCFVCLDCGYARPVMQRSADEHARMVAAGTPVRLVAKKP